MHILAMMFYKCPHYEEGGEESCVYKLEALYSFLHKLHPFCNFNRKEFDVLIKKIEVAF